MSYFTSIHDKNEQTTNKKLSTRNAGKFLNLLKSNYGEKEKKKTQADIIQSKDIHSHHVLLFSSWQEKDINDIEFEK